jgi:hypothetical protein
MITTIAQTLTLFCTVIVMAAASGWLLAYARGFRGAPAAQRIAVLFAVFALAAGYVWLDLGPEIDGRMATHFAPLLGEPKPLDI